MARVRRNQPVVLPLTVTEPSRTEAKTLGSDGALRTRKPRRTE